MAVNMRFAGSVTNNGNPVEGTIKVATTTTAAGVSGPISALGRFSVVVSSTAGDTVTVTIDCGQVFTGTTILEGVVAGELVDLSCDIGSGSLSSFGRFV